jgi:hypothetical protein
MSGRLNRLLTAAVVAGVVLVAPPAAFACNGGVSAVNVYKECLPTGGGGKATGGGSGTHTSGGSTTPVHISARTARALKNAGKDEKPLSALVRGYGATRLLQSHSTGAPTQPTAIGSAFDLGSGPTLLLIVLVGTAVVLLATSGFRVVRQRRR